MPTDAFVTPDDWSTSSPVSADRLQKLADDAYFLSRRHGVRLRRAAAQTIATGGAGADVSWDTEDEDYYGLAAVPLTSLTLPVGLWAIYCQIVWSAGNANAHGYLFIGSNGIPLASPQGVYAERGNTAVVYLDAATAVRVNAFQTSGGSLTLTGNLQAWKLAA